jgi:hypothetical protein
MTPTRNTKCLLESAERLQKQTNLQNRLYSGPEVKEETTLYHQH